MPRISSVFNVIIPVAVIIGHITDQVEKPHLSDLSILNWLPSALITVFQIGESKNSHAFLTQLYYRNKGYNF